jgi:protein TonB
MIAARELHPPATLWLCAALAVALHGALLFAWRMAPEESPASAIEGDSVEVALVESGPAAEAVAVPEPPVVPPEPVPIPPPDPEPPKKEPEMALPEPLKPKPTPPPRTAPSSPKATPQPARRPSSQPSSTAAATTGGASAPAGTSAGGAGIGRSAKATYVIRPVAAYPPESRAAGEHGVVILRLVVDGSGRPTSVTVGRSSGYPRLDRAAVEAGWRCRVRDAAPGSHLDAPVRFNLADR